MHIGFRGVVAGLRLKAAKIDKDGVLVEPAKVIVQLETPIDPQVVQRLSIAFEQDAEFTVETSQMELPWPGAAG